ncbi:MAG: hypothetical protein IH600_15850 [Bacteroidetes bacterium]|nr:hypothetical protein [Bacteroidota bacterium]
MQHGAGVRSQRCLLLCILLHTVYTCRANSPQPSHGNSRFLFVVNGNTFDGTLHAGGDPIGQRHITVKLGTNGSTVDEWRVTNVFTKDVWIVRANDTPDETSYSNGFTDYFAPGAAALYRLDPMVNETMDFTFSDGSGCASYDRSIYIEPAATLRLKDSDKLAFASGNGIFCDGYLCSEMPMAMLQQMVETTVSEHCSMASWR